MSFVTRALQKLLDHTQPTKRERRVAQFVNIREYATRYKEGVDGLQLYLQHLQNGEIEMKTYCRFQVVKDGWDAYLANALNNINNFIENDYKTWMWKLEEQQNQCAEEARELVIIDTVKQILRLWPEEKMSYCVLGTDYRADMEAQYGTPYAARVTDINNPSQEGDNEPIDQAIWNMVTAIEVTDEKLRAAIAALT
jgi:hypothetical protein